MTQASYFMRVENPSDLRRQILENSKSVIESLRRFEKIKDLRAEKLNSIVKLKRMISELHEISSRLRDSLPQPKTTPLIKRKLIRKGKKIEQKTVPAQKSVPAGLPFKPKSKDLEMLESELSEIESKLSKLE